jgi:hypothetical protein
MGRKGETSSKTTNADAVHSRYVIAVTTSAASPARLGFFGFRVNFVAGCVFGLHRLFAGDK